MLYRPEQSYKLATFTQKVLANNVVLFVRTVKSPRDVVEMFLIRINAKLTIQMMILVIYSVHYTSPQPQHVSVF